jgi:aspartyl protease family protein
MKQNLSIILIIALSFLSGCSGCSQSGRRNVVHTDRTTPSNEKQVRSIRKKTILRMENDDGVKYVWIEINGLRLRFIFDTGASSICISSSEASVLYRQGTLLKDDILDVQYFQDATGTISAGTRINLKTVKIGDRTLNNIEATVIDNNQAPLLLGQTAFEKFGKISIDNDKGEITFE